MKKIQLIEYGVIGIWDKAFIWGFPVSSCGSASQTLLLQGWGVHEFSQLHIVPRLGDFFSFENLVCLVGAPEG